MLLSSVNPSNPRLSRQKRIFQSGKSAFYSFLQASGHNPPNCYNRNFDPEMDVIGYKMTPLGG